MDDKLFKQGKPTFYIIPMEEAQFADLWLQLLHSHRESVIRMIRGAKSRTVLKFFDEFSAVLQFPYYFGENWAAFDECITDLDWIEGDAYLLMVRNADLLLDEDEDKDFRILIRSLTEANELWLTPNLYIPRMRKPTPFHVLFQCDESNIAEFSQKLGDLGGHFEVLEALY
jgi:hypothetical protein